MNPIITEDLVNFVEKNILDTVKIQRLQESSAVREYHKLGLSYDTLKNENLVLVNNSVEAISGINITVPSNTVSKEFFHFSTPTKFYNTNELKAGERPAIEVLSERCSKYRCGCMVFVNGYKVPDATIYIYATNVGTDIFIPTRYFSMNKPNDLVLVKKDYSNKNYYSKYLAKSSSTTVTQIRVPNDDKCHIDVWIDGVHMNDDEYELFNIETLSETSVMYSIQFTSIVPNESEIEIIFDSSHQIKSTNNHWLSRKNGDLWIYFLADDQTLIKNAVFANMCDIYVDGLRIPSIIIQQKTYRHFMLAGVDPDKLSYKTEIVVSDSGIPFESIIDYIDDFIQYERWVTDEEFFRTVEREDDLNDIVIKPPFIEKDNLVFPPTKLYLVDTNDKFDLTFEERLGKIIQENPLYVRQILRYFGIEEEEYEIIRNGRVHENEQVHLLLDTNYVDSLNRNTRNLEAYVNSKKVLDSVITYDVKHGADYANFPIRLFSLGVTTEDRRDYLKVYRSYPNNWGMNFLRFKLTDDPVSGAELEIVLDDIPDAEITKRWSEMYEASELRLFRLIPDKSARSDLTYLNIPGAEVFYEFIEPINYTIERREISGVEKLVLTIPEGSNLRKNDVVCIVNPQFFIHKTFNIAMSDDASSKFRVVLNDMLDGEVLPMIFDKYLVKVFVNGKLLNPRFDYSILTPADDNTVTSSSVIFNRRIYSTDVIEVEISGLKNRWLASYKSLTSMNKWGLMYLPNLSIPFDMDYMDVFVNGEKLGYDDIDIISSKLIRIKKSLPYDDVIIVSRLSIDIGLLSKYLNIYEAFNAAGFDGYISRMTDGMLFDDTSGDGEEYTDDAIETYKKLHEGDEGNPEDEEHELPEGVTDPFYDRLVRDFNADRNLMSKVFDANKLKDIYSDEYAVLIPSEVRRTGLVIFDANAERSVISECFQFDANLNYRTSAQILELLRQVHTELEDVMDANKFIEQENIKSVMEPYLYQHELIMLDANKPFTDERDDEDVVFDSNKIA